MNAPFIRRILPFLFFSTLFSTSSTAQQNYHVGLVGFYNFENLFDTLDTPNVEDEEFTPQGSRLWTGERYRDKLDHLAKVVEELGADLSPDGLAILGVAEIENRSVLEDFVAHPKLSERNYQIVHFNSPDFRGIDVALLYNPKYFEVTHQRAIPLKIYDDDGELRPTRDILLVSGIFDGDPLHVLVNHWPSRRGGQKATQDYRNAGALICKKICDSITTVDPMARVIIMGDLNDDPVSPSVRKVLDAKRSPDLVPPGGLYNPMYDYFKKGLGTLAYRDAWSLFDQILLTSGFLQDENGYRYHATFIHNPIYLTQRSGRFKGYPMRTYGGSEYLGGYSDHFPVYVALLKEVNP